MVTKVDGPQRVYNLEVASLDGQITHNYFVGEDEVWTHNVNIGSLQFHSPKFGKRGQHRIFGIRRANGQKNVFRLDIGKIPGSCNKRVLHVHIGKNEGRHFPLNPKFWNL